LREISLAAGRLQLRCGAARFAIDFWLETLFRAGVLYRAAFELNGVDRMRARYADGTTLMAFAVAAIIGAGALATIGHANGFVASRNPASEPVKAPFVLAQNPTNPFSLPEMPEPPVSPINPGTLPGTTSAIGGSATGTNPITGLPCNGTGSISVSGAGGLPGTATPPPGVNETLGQIPVGTPPFTSIYGSQTNLGSC
jgi:hypothetical protein